MEQQIPLHFANLTPIITPMMAIKTLSFAPTILGSFNNLLMGWI